MTSLAKRSGGVLLPIFSLPGPVGTGALGRNANRFAHFLRDSGQTWWQMLPINPIDPFHSPYSSGSTFAGEALYLDLEDFVRENLLDPSDLDGVWNPLAEKTESGNVADYQQAISLRHPVWRKAFERYRSGRGGATYRAREAAFRAENDFWLTHHLLFQALAGRFGTRDWSQWPLEYRRREKSALDRVRDESADDMAFVGFLQLAFDVQWHSFRKTCNDLGVKLLGDLPIYVGLASADTWAHREFFLLDEDGRMERTSGAPADAFNPDGQRWDSPLYRWERLEEAGFDWWIRRVAKALSRFDAVRLDHFIGFYNFYSFPFLRRDRSLPLTGNEPTHGLKPATPFDADGGFWTKGPAESLLDALFAHFSRESFIAEDLGVMTPGVHELRDHYALPGMEVLPFSFDYRQDGSPDPTSSWPERSVACSGTHDTQTLLGWLRSLRSPDFSGPVSYSFVAKTLWEYLPEEEKRLGHYDRTLNPNEVNEDDLLRLTLGGIRAVLNSRSQTALFPLQDILRLGDDARMNFPGRCDGNWLWRLRAEELTDAVQEDLLRLTHEAGR